MAKVAGIAALMMAIAGAALAVDGPTVDIPVLSQPVAAGARIEPGQLVMKSVPAGNVFAGTIKDASELSGMQAARALAAGVPLTKLQVKPMADVQSGALVSLLYRAPGVELSGSGQALQAGRVGDSIKVLNPGSRATVVGVVVAANAVEVRPLAAPAPDAGDAQ